jgi:hypothetical protein
MPLTERVIETDKTHQRVEAERGARGVQLCTGTTVAAASAALERELAVELVERLREHYPSLHPFMAAAERVGATEATLRVAESVGAPGELLADLAADLTRAHEAWTALPDLEPTSQLEVVAAYGRLLAIVARDPCSAHT